MYSRHSTVAHFSDRTFVSSSFRDPGYHARSRRICAPAFRGETLRASSSDLLQEMEDLVGRLRRDCADGGYVDVVQLFPALALDVSVRIIIQTRSVLTSVLTSLGLAVLGVRFNQIASGQLSEFQKVCSVVLEYENSG